MPFTFNIFLLIFSIGAFQGFVLSGLILFKRHQKTYSYYFGLLLLVFSLGILKIILQETLPDFLNAFRLPLLYKFASGPLLYLFIRELLFKNTRSLRIIAPHFIPALLLDVLYRTGFHWLGFRNEDSVIQALHFLTDMAAVVSYGVYALLALRLWLRFKSGLKGHCSLANRRVLFWTKSLLLVDLLSTFTCVIYILLTLYNGGFLLGQTMTYYLPNVAAAFYIYFLCYLSYSLPEIEIIVPRVQAAPHRSEIDNESQLVLICESIRKHKYYTEPDLSLHKLATHLGIPARDCSTIINKGFKQNFNDFINGFRIAHFKELLLENGDLYSIEGLAYEAGFKSKASFYRAFKNVTGQTPLQFLKEKQVMLAK